MAQVFRRRSNTIARASLAVAGLLAVGAGLLGYALTRSAYATRVTIVPEQPVPFSHQHHVSGLGIDCRYCHQSVEVSNSAGMPATQTCMQCHSQIWSDAPILEPVRASWRTGKPIRWTRVHDVPDFVYFNHSIHVQKGVGCSTCHGNVDQMPLMWKTATLFMEWCLDCHRNPEKNVRPKDKIYDMTWRPARDHAENEGRRLVEAYGIKTEGLTNCTVCHR